MAFCKICQISDDLFFYSGINAYCKEHWKERVRANRLANIDHYRNYDKARASIPHRVSARNEYQKTTEGLASHKAACHRWIKKHPDRRNAHNILASALRRGEVVKLPCFICGSLEVEAHHPSYDLPLVVTWLCVEHHKEIHWPKLAHKSL